jgi:hypothetical protein
LVCMMRLAIHPRMPPTIIHKIKFISSPDYSSTRKIGQRRDFGIEDDPQTSRIPGAS